ncbi:MAG TPA: hypothetical protein VLC74_03245 [Rhizomicrobium sp.]|nr:hypothetical protein [Rhizomicrobium sp.]
MADPPYDLRFQEVLAWICTRRYELMEAISESPELEIVEAINRLGKGPTQGIKLLMEPEAAWSALKSGAVDGKIRLFGYPFEKSPHFSGIGGIDVVESERELRSGRLPPKEIQPELWERLQLYIGPDGYRLKPLDWITNGGWCWKEIEVWNWDQILRLFPERSLDPAHKQFPRKLGPKVYVTVQLIEAKWPHGTWRSVTRLQMLDILNKEFPNHAPGLEHNRISAETLKRAIRVLKGRASTL